MDITELTIDPVCVRILGTLIEKETTTPDYYPMTLNSLINACNQKSNREPVMQLSEETVMNALDDLKAKRLIWQRTVFGARAMKYEHNIKSFFEFTDKQLAVLCILMLRGPQTIGEIRLRTERMCTFESLEEAESAVRSLIAQDDGPLVLELPRQPGRKEPRFIHLFSGKQWADESGKTVDAPSGDTSPVADGKSSGERIAELENLVSDLQVQIAKLRREFEEFRSGYPGKTSESG
jgi:uncharacterized protein